MDTTTAVAELIKAVGLTVALLLIFGATVLGAAGLFARSYLARLARQSLDKELATHTQKLQIEAESLRTDQQRRLKDFDLYSRERHRAYAGLYKRLQVAEGALTSLWGLLYERTYEDATSDDIKELLSEKHIPGKTSQEILGAWDTHNDLSRKKLREALLQWKRNYASRKLGDARNYQVLNELYFSPAASDAIEECYQRLVKYWVYAKNEDRDRDGETLPARQSDARAALVRLRDLLRSEMQRGDYPATAEVAAIRAG